MKRPILFLGLLLICTGLLSWRFGNLISGSIQTPFGEPMTAITVDYSGAATGSTSTDITGSYIINDNYGLGDVINITPQSAPPPCDLSCVDIYDFYLIGQHIQGLQPLGSPYAILAADLNNSQTITTADLLLLNQLLSGNLTSLPNATCQCFYDANYLFPDPTNPFVETVPQSIAHIYGQSPNPPNFIGVQKGDVSGCTDAPMESALSFNITNNLTVPQGTQVSIPITTSNFAAINGFQFTVQWDPVVLNFTGFDGFGGLNGFSTFDVGQSEASSGYLRATWVSDDSAESLPDGSLLFAMRFEATGNPGSSSAVAINGSRIAVLGLDDTVQPILPLTTDGSVTIEGFTDPECQIDLAFVPLDSVTHACCWSMDFLNQGTTPLHALELTALDGVTFDYELATGYIAPNNSPNSVLISPDPLGPMPTAIANLLDICFDNVYVSPQRVVARYYDPEYQVFCVDTLLFECPIEPLCLEILSDSLSCDSVGYRYTLDVAVPPGSDFDLGLIKLNVTAPAALAGSYPYVFSTPLQAGDQATIDFPLVTSNLYSNLDSLCYILTAHNGPGEELCCFALDTCIVFPVCDPCPAVGAMVSPAEEACCYQLSLTNNYQDAPGYFTQVQTAILTPGVTFSSIDYQLGSGWQQNSSSTNQNILWDFSPSVPLATFDFFEFCIEGVTSTDSVCIAVNWLNNEDIVCRDTVKVFCPECILITEEEWSCNPFNGTYTYTFSGINYSDQFANTLSLIESSTDFDLAPNPISLGGTVPPLGAFGPLSINILPTGAVPGDTLCFDLVLRNVIVDSINIECCYLTHCLILPECDTEPECLDVTCVPPPDISISCDQLPPDFDPNDTGMLAALFGEPTANTVCPDFTWVEASPMVDLDDCNTGIIIRSFIVTASNGNSSSNICEQVITILPQPNYAIRFPADLTGDCSILENPGDQIQLESGLCDMMVVNIIGEEVVEGPGDICLLVLREYRIINWCEWDGNTPPVVIDRDEDCDGIPGNNPVWLIVDQNASHTDADNDPVNTNPAAGTRPTSCDGQTNPAGHWRNSIDHPGLASVGYWSYTQYLTIPAIPLQYIYSIGDQFCINENTNCLAEVSVVVDLLSDCPLGAPTTLITYDENDDGTAEAITEIAPNGTITELVGAGTITIGGAFPSWTLSLEAPVGIHLLVVQGQNICGGGESFFLPFEVEDCDPPFAFCIAELSTELMSLDFPYDADGDGDTDFAAINIVATDYILEEALDCSTPITYAIARPGDGVPPMNQLTLPMTCDDLGVVDLNVYYWDAEGNFDFCAVQLTVQDPQNLCGNTPFTGDEPVRMYPNPVTNQLMLSSTKGGLTEAHLLSGDGTLHQRQPLRSVTTNQGINLSGLRPGVYWLRIRYADGTQYTQRFIKM